MIHSTIATATWVCRFPSLIFRMVLRMEFHSAGRVRLRVCSDITCLEKCRRTSWTSIRVKRTCPPNSEQTLRSAAEQQLVSIAIETEPPANEFSRLARSSRHVARDPNKVYRSPRRACNATRVPSRVWLLTFQNRRTCFACEARRRGTESAASSQTVTVSAGVAAQGEGIGCGGFGSAEARAFFFAPQQRSNIPGLFMGSEIPGLFEPH